VAATVTNTKVVGLSASRFTAFSTTVLCRTAATTTARRTGFADAAYARVTFVSASVSADPTIAATLSAASSGDDDSIG
jgi:hypothetical protein